MFLGRLKAEHITVSNDLIKIRIQSQVTQVLLTLFEADRLLPIQAGKQDVHILQFQPPIHLTMVQMVVGVHYVRIRILMNYPDGTGQYAERYYGGIMLKRRNRGI